MNLQTARRLGSTRPVVIPLDRIVTQLFREPERAPLRVINGPNGYLSIQTGYEPASAKDIIASQASLQVIGALGEGGQADVLECNDLDPTSKRTYALKLLKGTAPDLPKIAAAHGLQHKLAKSDERIAAPYRFGVLVTESDVVHFEAHELVGEGINLKQVMAAQLEQGRTMPLGAVLDYGIDAGEPLAAVQSAGWVHHDVKPSNLAVDPSGRVKLIDFGISYQIGGEFAPEEGTVLGTPRYLWALFDPERPSQTDIFGLAVTMLEAATGNVPSAGASTNAMAIYYNILSADRWQPIHRFLDAKSPYLSAARRLDQEFFPRAFSRSVEEQFATVEDALGVLYSVREGTQKLSIDSESTRMQLLADARAEYCNRPVDNITTLLQLRRQKPVPQIGTHALTQKQAA